MSDLVDCVCCYGGHLTLAVIANNKVGLVAHTHQPRSGRGIPTPPL